MNFSISYENVIEVIVMNYARVCLNFIICKNCSCKEYKTSCLLGLLTWVFKTRLKYLFQTSFRGSVFACP